MAVDPQIAQATSTIGKSFLQILVPPLVGVIIVLLIILGVKNKLPKKGNYKPENKLEKCPLDVGNLVERNGKFGKFIGCSNYPKCHYTKSEKS